VGKAKVVSQRLEGLIVPFAYNDVLQIGDANTESRKNG